MDLTRHIWEGWTVGDFIEALQLQADIIMMGMSLRKPFTSRAELEAWCKDNQPYYKKPIPEVVEYFIDRYGIRE